MIKMLFRKLRRRFFNYGTIMKTVSKVERRLNKYRGEMLDEAAEYTNMITLAVLARGAAEDGAARSEKSLKVLASITSSE